MKRTAVMALCALAGCASITQGTSQMLTFNIEPKEARCTLNRVDDGVLGHVSASSNIITVTKDKDDIVVVCRAPGYRDVTTKIVSAASGGGVASVFLLDFGITDLATGAFWKYPETHSIVMEREGAGTAVAHASPPADARAETKTPVAPQERHPLAGTEVLALHHGPTAFVVQTLEEPFAAETPFVPVLVGTATTAARLMEGQELGARLQDDLKLEDPAPQVKNRLAEFLQVTYSASIRSAAEPPASEEIDALRQSFGPATVLDVRTTSWGIFNYHPRFVSRARLVRLADASVVWQGVCEQPVPSRAARGDESAMGALLANNGEALKAKLQHRVDSCAEQLVASLAATRIAAPDPGLGARPPNADRASRIQQPGHLERGRDSGGNIRFQSQGPGGPERGVYQNPMECGGRMCR